VVEGYESERQARSRRKREKAATEAERKKLAATAKALIPETLARLRGTAPDCVIEKPYRPLFAASGTEKVRKGRPAWYLGEISPGIDPGNYVPASTHYALDERGKLYTNTYGVQGRKQFVCKLSGAVSPPPDAQFVGLLRSVGKRVT
jgi:hypothetical protein